jgi:O-antigen/teichoic acid export membrane protein
MRLRSRFRRRGAGLTALVTVALLGALRNRSRRRAKDQAVAAEPPPPARPAEPPAQQAPAEPPPREPPPLPEPSPPDPAPATGDDDADTITRNTAFALASQIATASFTAILTIVLVRVLGPEDYGVFALALSVASLVFLPADFGISQSTGRFVAEHRGQREQIASVMADGLKLKFASSALICLILFAVAEPIAHAYDAPELTWPLRGVALALFGQSMMGFYRTSFEAIGRVRLNLRLVFSESAVEAGASIALVLAGAGVVGAAFGRAIGYAFGTALALWLARKAIGPGAISLRGSPAGRLRQIAGYAGALLIIDAIFAALTQVDILLIGAILGTSAVGIFQAPAKLITFLHYPGLALSAGISPRLARSGEGPNVQAFATGIRYLMILQAVMVVPTIVWAGPITDLVLGDEFAESADVMRALAPLTFLFGIAPLVSVGVNYLGEARRRIPIAIVALIANFIVSIVLLNEIGVVGSAIGADVAYLIYVPAHFWICKRLIGLPVRPVVVTFARTLLAGGAMALVMLAFGYNELSVLDWFAGIAAGVVTYCVALVLTGEVDRSEIGAIRRAIGGRLS